jgi:hypothetical protein
MTKGIEEIELMRLPRILAAFTSAVSLSLVLAFLCNAVRAQSAESVSDAPLRKSDSRKIDTLSAPISAILSAPSIPLTRFRIGEKLSYNISFGKFPNAGYAETHVVSLGTLNGRGAVEVHSKVRTHELFSAAFLLFDESRIVFAAPDTALPLYISRDIHEGPIPKETISNFLGEPTANYDLLTLLFRARETAGIGSFPLTENEQSYTAIFAAVGSERIRTEAGEFDTTISAVQSEFFASMGIREIKVNFTIDEFHVPVLIRMKSAKGEYRLALASIVLPPAAAPTATPTASPTPAPTPKPPPTPEKYVDNRPLAPELGFQIGEQLNYRVANAGRPVASISLNVRERKQLESKEGNEDRLLLTATVTGVEPGASDFVVGDGAKVYVDPETLAPRLIESRFNSNFAGLNHTAQFDKASGNISFGPGQVVDGPVGTQSILSLVYAMRSFNLRPSKDLGNPVNDTRVAVFWETKPYVFTLRPGNPDDIILNGEKVSAQVIAVNTGNPSLDNLAIKVWLGTDDRVPVRVSFGAYQADLISRALNPLK